MNGAPLENRSATVTDVRFPERIIDVVAVPYDEWAVVEYKGRLIEEAFNRGAFGNVQNRANRVLVTAEHDLSKVVGRVKALHPNREEGLVAEMRIRRGPEGDQMLEDADDGMIGASINFGAMPEHQRWETRSRRRILKAFLGNHIALTWMQTYAGANVLAVRSAFTPSASPPPAGGTPAAVAVPDLETVATVAGTPNLDGIRLAELAARYGAR